MTGDMYNPRLNVATSPAWAYDEDGYCVCCGNGRWKHHMPECELADALDAFRDPVAAVRRGVESGTIKGRELDWLDPDNEGQFRRVLVIPVSDGGEDRP